MLTSEVGKRLLLLGLLRQSTESQIHMQLKALLAFSSSKYLGQGLSAQVSRGKEKIVHISVQLRQYSCPYCPLPHVVFQETPKMEQTKAVHGDDVTSPQPHRREVTGVTNLVESPQGPAFEHVASLSVLTCSVEAERRRWHVCVGPLSRCIGAILSFFANYVRMLVNSRSPFPLCLESTAPPAYLQPYSAPVVTINSSRRPLHE